MASALTAATVLEELAISVNTTGRKEPVQQHTRVADFKSRASRALLLKSSEAFTASIENARSTIQQENVHSLVLDGLTIVEDMLKVGNLTAARILHDIVVDQSSRCQVRTLLLTGKDPCSRAQLVGALMAFFVEGSPPAASNNLVTAVQSVGEAGPPQSDGDRARQDVIQSLFHLLQVDVGRGARSGDFLRLAQSFSGYDAATTIETYAVSVSNQQNITDQETKMYANLILVVSGCRCMTIGDDVSSFASKSETTAELMFLNPSKMGYRRRDRRKVLKYAVCLLDAFHEIYDSDPIATASNWVQTQCGLFGACVIDTILPACDKIDLQHAKTVLERFDTIFNDLKNNSGSINFSQQPSVSSQVQSSASTTEAGPSNTTNQFPTQHSSRSSQRSRRQSRSIRRRGRQTATTGPIDVISQGVWSELQAIQEYLMTTAAMMNRSSKAPFMWLTTIPQSAMQHDCVLHAVLSSVEGSKAVLHCQAGMSPLKDRCQSQALRWTNSAIRDVLEKPVPVDAILLMSLLLSNVDLLSGRPGDAFMHVQHAFNLSHSKDMTDSRSPIRGYCQTYLKSLIEVQDFKAGRNSSRKLRLVQAMKSLRATNHEIEDLLQLLDKSCLGERRKIISVLKIVQYEIQWLLPRWQKHWVAASQDDVQHNDADEEGDDEVFLPWAVGTRQLHQYLTTGHDFDIIEFEIAMERTMPLYSLSKFWLDEDIRAEVVQLMMMSAAIRGKDGSTGLSGLSS